MSKGESPGPSSTPRPLVVRHGANLPHWTREGATYSVTFRLADSLPQAVLEAGVIERDHIIARAARLEREHTEHELSRLEELHSDKVEKFLDGKSSAPYNHCRGHGRELASA